MENSIDILNPVGLEKIGLSETHAIVFAPKPRSKRSYGITIRYYEHGNEQVSKRIDYQIHLSIEQFKNENRTWQLCFDKTALYIDQHEPDLVSEQLAATAMHTVFPVKVDVTAKNEVFRGIVNHQEIINRWAKSSEKIRDKYEGEIITLFLNKMTQKINDCTELEYALKLDMFWSVFFHPQYFNYESDLTQEIRFSFPVIAYQNLIFEGKQLLEPHYTDYGTYHVNFNSVKLLTDDLRMKINTKAANQMSLSAQWDLDKDSGLLKHATVNWNLFHGDTSEKTIFFSAYQIEHKHEEGNSNLILENGDGLGKVEKKKGFWARMMS